MSYPFLLQSYSHLWVHLPQLLPTRADRNQSEFIRAYQNQSDFLRLVLSDSDKFRFTMSNIPPAPYHPLPPQQRIFIHQPVHEPPQSCAPPSTDLRTSRPTAAHLRPCLCVPLLHTLAFEGRSEPIGVYQSLSESIRFPPISSD